MGTCLTQQLLHTHLPVMSLFGFPVATIMHNHKPSGLKQYQSIHSHFWRSESKIKVLEGHFLLEASGQNLSPCHLKFLRANRRALLVIPSHLSHMSPPCCLFILMHPAAGQLSFSASLQRGMYGHTNTGGEDSLLTSCP